ncbi:MAG: hypothetical protein Q4F28_00755 [Eubacteriales bacterium]|nr:hypothetical protein [Eubacteriales bacterium]
MEKEYVPLNCKRLLSMSDFQKYASIGRNNAFKLVKRAGCEIRIGNRVYADRVAFDEWCSSQTINKI